MSKCITLASILTFTACTHRPPAPAPSAPASPPPRTAAERVPVPVVAPASTPVAAPVAAPIRPPVPAACRVTRAGTCWGEAPRPRVTKAAPAEGAQP